MTEFPNRGAEFNARAMALPTRAAELQTRSAELDARAMEFWIRKDGALGSKRGALDSKRGAPGSNGGAQGPDDGAPGQIERMHPPCCPPMPSASRDDYRAATGAASLKNDSYCTQQQVSTACQPPERQRQRIFGSERRTLSIRHSPCQSLKRRHAIGTIPCLGRCFCGMVSALRAFFDACRRLHWKQSDIAA